MKSTRTAEEKAKYWETEVEAYRKSGLNQREYCRQKGISYWSFNPWKRKLENKDNKPQEIPPSLISSLSPQNKQIELILEDRIKISIPDNFSEGTLRNILNILGVKR
jgi:hypothetical protein